MAEVETKELGRWIPTDDLQFHPVADIFPPMSEHEFRDLVEDIREHGQREAVWVLPGGEVIDGKHRVKACAELGRSVEARVYHGDGDALTAFVVSLNLKRRHLSTSQRDMIAARLENTHHGGDRRGDQDANLHLVTRAEAARLLNVSERGVADAAAVQRTGTPELQQAVDEGHVSVSAAADVAVLPEEEQRQVVEQGSDAVREKAREIRESKRPHVSNNSGEMEWYTPPDIIERARKVMGEIDCDPASSAKANEIVQAETFYTKDNDGLKQNWRGRVWLNPPYGQPAIAEFAEAVSAKYEAGEIAEACVLVNNATETNWFQRMLRACTAVCFLKGRVKFIDANGSPTGAPLQGQAVLYFGKNEAIEFQEHFDEIGVVLI